MEANKIKVTPKYDKTREDTRSDFHIWFFVKLIFPAGKKRLDYGSYLWMFKVKEGTDLTTLTIIKCIRNELWQNVYHIVALNKYSHKVSFH